ncbi:uncharacterized protein LOC133353945 [Lethenteron reissneri]|uniref:uncharacterized protein LOC133353945 n=1 Tax=Lethenteron reissneri TaxID=7753 RepID=UPI002AB78522|nr:uncharacterized protein LOC133353945 [Lethenteron reissneri]
MTAVAPGLLLLLLTLTLCDSTGPAHAERTRAPSGLHVLPPEYPMQLRLRWEPAGNASQPEGALVNYALQIFHYSASKRKELQCILTPLTNYTNSQFSAVAAWARVGVVSWHADACTNSSQRHSNWSEPVDISSPRGLSGSAASGVRCALLTGAAGTMECTWTRGLNASADTEYSLYYWHSTLNATRRCVPCTHERLTAADADTATELCHHSGRGAGHGKKAVTKQRKTRPGISSGTWSTTHGAAGGAADSAAEATGRTAAASAGAAVPGGGGGAAPVPQRCCVPLADVPEYRSFRILVNGTSAHHDVTPFYCPLPVESLVKPDPPSELHVHLNGSSLLVKWDPLPGYQRHQSTCYQTDMRIHSVPQDMSTVGGGGGGHYKDHQEVSEPRASWPPPEPQGCHAVTFRVRARPGRCKAHGVRGLWSEWSPEARYIPSPAALLCADAHGDGNATGHRTRVAEYPEPRGALGGQEPQPLAWFLASGLVALSVVVLALVFVYKSQRLRRCLVPWVPDPSRYFKSLFDVHNGDFQAWAGFQASGKPAAPSAAAAGAAGDEAEEGSPVPLCVLSEMVALNVGVGGVGGVGGTNGYLNLETVGTETALLWQHG